MTAPYIPDPGFIRRPILGTDIGFEPRLDPMDPYGLRKRALDPAFLATLRQPADGTAAGPPPLAPPPTIGPRKAADTLTEAPESDFKRMMRSLGKDVDQAITDTPWFGALWPMIKGTASDAAEFGKIALEPTGIVDAPPPGSPSRGERLTEKGLPLVAAAWPMGRGAKMAEEAIAAIDAAAPRGIVKAINEGERSIGTDATGYTITNRGRALRPSAPPTPTPVVSEAEIALGRPDAEGVVQTSRGRSVNVGKPLPRPNSVAEKITQAAVRDPVTGKTYPGVIHEDGRTAWAEAGGDAMIPPERGYMTNRGRFIPEDLAKEATGKPDFSSKDIGPRGHPLSLDNTLAGESMSHGPVGVLPGPDNNKTRVIADKLIKQDAVSRAQALTKAGQRVEMRQGPDGTWSILKKGEPGVAVAKAESKAVRKIGPMGSANEGGFQSRLLTAVEYSGERRLSPQEWYNKLKNNPDVPKAELDAVLNKGEQMVLAERHPNGISSADLQEHITESSPAARLERKVQSNEGGSDPGNGGEPHEITHDMLQQEIEHYMEFERESMKENVADLVGRRDKSVQDFAGLLEPVLGQEGTKKWMREHLGDKLYSADDLMDETTDHVRDEIIDGFDDDMVGAFTSLRSPTDQLALGDNVRRDFTDEEWKQLNIKFNEIQRRDREAAEHAKDVRDENYDMNYIEQQARESLEEWANENAPADTNREPFETEYHHYQRVDEQSPYREILIHMPNSGARGGHFSESQDLVAHARGEIHGDTYLMIEAQSDMAQRARSSDASMGSGGADVFGDTERWAQLSTGGSLIQAAEEKKDWFSWVSSENRQNRAGLAREAADITYGSAVPKAVQRIFKWLDIPMEREEWKPNGFGTGHTFFRVKLTPEARQKILKAGIPALGLVGASAISVKSQAGKKSRGTAEPQ